MSGAGRDQGGQKRSHWMWFIFPQHRELGRSPMAKFYGLSGEEEARAYLAHPLLGPRYRECVAAVQAQVARAGSLEAIFGDLDAMKFRSSVEIFGVAFGSELSAMRKEGAGP